MAASEDFLGCAYTTLEELGSCINDNLAVQIDEQTTSIDTFWLCEYKKSYVHTARQILLNDAVREVFNR